MKSDLFKCLINLFARAVSYPNVWPFAALVLLLTIVFSISSWSCEPEEMCIGFSSLCCFHVSFWKTCFLFSKFSDDECYFYFSETLVLILDYSMMLKQCLASMKSCILWTPSGNHFQSLIFIFKICSAICCWRKYSASCSELYEHSCHICIWWLLSLQEGPWWGQIGLIFDCGLDIQTWLFAVGCRRRRDVMTPEFVGMMICYLKKRSGVNKRRSRAAAVCVTLWSQMRALEDLCCLFL